jgi:FAD/FMN-containing dehydrogenase
MSTVLDRAALEGLTASIRGDVIEPDDDRYEDARKVWSGTTDRRPAVIARCSGVADVLAVVGLARSTRLPLAVRGGGHSAPGYGTCDDGIVLDLSPMKGIRVDPERRTVRAEGGVTWGELDRETQAFGLATTGGVVSTTGVAGLTLGGGIGWLMRKHGLACDNLISADVITADGRLLMTSAEQHPDLFWALRGGGGNFGVVTSLELRLHPVGPEVYGGLLIYTVDRAADVLRMVRDWVPETPEELGIAVALTGAPAAPFIPEELHGQPIAGVVICFTGPDEGRERMLAPLRELDPAVDMVGPMPYTAVQSMLDAGYPHGTLSYWKSGFVRALDDDLIGALVGSMATRPTAECEALIEFLYGAPLRVDADETAFGNRSAPLNVLFFARWSDRGDADACIEWTRGAFGSTERYRTGEVYLNYLGDEGDERIRAAVGDRHYARLRAVKTAYDPENLFRLNQNIPPQS